MIDKPILELLEELGFAETKSKGLYSTMIENGTAFIDFRKENGRRYANIDGKLIESKNADTVPILKTFKEEKDKLQSGIYHCKGCNQGFGLFRDKQEHENVCGKLQSLAQSQDMEAHDTTKGKDSKDKNILNAPRSGKVEGEPKKSPSELLLSKDKAQEHTPPSIQPAGIPSNIQPPNAPAVERERSPSIDISPEGVKSPPSPTPSKHVFWDELVPYYEIDICEVFGAAGSGKSQLAKELAIEAIKRGKKVIYVDTERGFLKRDILKLGSAYKYISKLKKQNSEESDGILDYVQKIPKDIDFFVLDSVGYPVLTEWAKMDTKNRGDALTQIIAIKDFIKDWAINNGKVALVINQPDSDFGKAADYVNRPFGDKGQFVIKEVFYIRRIDKQSNTTRTVSVLESFRSRHDPRGTLLAQIDISEAGVKII